MGAGGAVQVVGFLAAFVVSTCAGLQAFGLVPSSGRAFPPFGRFPALRLVRWLEI